MSNLGKETAKGVAWSGIEKIASGGVQFLANIILARLLTPEDFGLIAIIAIFIQIAQVFIDSGFTNALIQRKNRTANDYSTVFIFNLLIAILLYILLYFTAPIISHFFKNSELTSLTRVIGLNLIIGSLSSVQLTKLSIELRFKIQAIISLLSSILSAVISIYLAYSGFGIWSLVILSLSNFTIQTILIYSLVRWFPSINFSKESFKNLFGYSSKILGTSIISLMYKNIYPIVIAKLFNPIDLGYFNRADTYAMYPSTIIGSIMSKVSFPIFSKIQDDNKKLITAYSNYIIYSSLVIFPLMVYMIALAKPLTLLVLTEKWLPMVPLLQILCLDWMTDHLSKINLNILYVKGRSDLALKLEIIKKIIAISIFIISIFWGLIGICWGRAIYGVIAVYINSYYTDKLIGIKISCQLNDIFIPFTFAILSGIIVFIISFLTNSLILKILVSSIIGLLIYLILISIFRKNYITGLLSVISKQ